MIFPTEQDGKIPMWRRLQPARDNPRRRNT